MTEDQAIVLTVLRDRSRLGEGSATVDEIAAGTAWPGERTFGVARTRRILRQLQAAGHVRRIASRAGGVRWSADALALEHLGGDDAHTRNSSSATSRAKSSAVYPMLGGCASTQPPPRSLCP